MKRILFLLTIILFGFTLFGVQEIKAATPAPNTKFTPPVVKLENPLGPGRVDLRIILGQIIAKGLGVIGALTLAVFFVGGFMWLTSAGNSEKIKNGTDAMLYAVVGLFIIFGSYAILNTFLAGIGAEEQTAAAKNGCYCVAAQQEMKMIQAIGPDDCTKLSNTTDATLGSITSCQWYGAVPGPTFGGKK